MFIRIRASVFDNHAVRDTDLRVHEDVSCSKDTLIVLGSSHGVGPPWPNTSRGILAGADADALL